MDPIVPPAALNISGVLPHLAVVAGHLPQRSETGIGALMPWADRLWMITYVAHLAESGTQTGLFEINADFRMKRHSESVVGTYANRMIHSQSDQLVIGPHVIDTEGNVRTIVGVVNHRLTATMEHLTDPKNKVYFLTMEGLLFEANVRTLESKLLCDVVEELSITRQIFRHFKGGYTAHGRVVVANNTYQEDDALGKHHDGILAEWDGKDWTVLERAPFVEATGRKNLTEAIYATGWDRASAILKVYTPASRGWKTYRLPKATHAQDNTVCTEWPRIREVESERFLMNISGMFYELPAFSYGGHTWGVKPICQHLRIIGDFCSWRGLLVLAGDQTTPIWDKNIFVGQPQANLWFGKTDDLWSFGGKPQGWGGPWWAADVAAGTPSDPYLMTGFDKKCLHLSHKSDRSINISIEVDFLGDGAWQTYDLIEVPPNGYRHHEFPRAFSAHWVRFVSDVACNATAYLTYT